MPTLYRRLRPVVGAAEMCAPCVLSAVTGRPSEDWPDTGMLGGDMERTLLEAGCRPARFTERSPALEQPLAEFCHSLSHWPIKNPRGVWVLMLGWPGDEPNHVVAVEVYGLTKLKRRFVDNHYRRPTALSHVVRNKHFSGAFVGQGWYLLANSGAG